MVTKKKNISQSLPLVLLVFSTVLPFSVSAGLRVMTENELADRMAACQQNKECKKAYDRITLEQTKKQKEFESICRRDKQACQKLIESKAAELAGYIAYCHSNSSSCIDEINKNAEAQEDALVESRWCKPNLKVCNYIKSLRENRSRTGITWCDDNKAACDKELNRVKTTQDKLEQRRIEAKAKQEKRQIAALKQKIRNDWYKRDVEYIRCNDLETCETTINRALQSKAALRAQKICERDRDSELCKVSSEIGKELDTDGTRWCDQNLNDCKQARYNLQMQ